MAQDTILLVKNVEVIPPREMETVPIYVANISIVDMAKPLVEALYWMIKADSNNTTNVCDPDDISELKAQIGWYKTIKDHSKNNIDQPKPTLETELAVLIPSPTEMKKFNNKCWEQVGNQIYRLLRVLLDLSERGLKLHIAPESFKKLEDAEKALANSMVKFFDSKIAPPSLSALGRLMPDPDFDYERPRIPSADLPRLGLPDAPDTQIVTSERN